MFTNINSEDRLVQKSLADHLQKKLGWEGVYAFNEETFGPNGTLGRSSEKEMVLTRDLRQAVARINPDLPPQAVEEVVRKLTSYDFSRSTLQHNRDFYRLIRDGVPITYQDAQNRPKDAHAYVIDFKNRTAPDGKPYNRFLAVRELKITGLTVPYYPRRADLVLFVNGLPLVFIELKAVYKNIRHGYDGNISDYFDTIPHAFYHNAFIIVSNLDYARYGSITSKWDHYAEWKRNDEKDKGSIRARVLIEGMLAKDRLLDIIQNFIMFDDSRAGGTRKIVARNHQVLGVNKAVDSVKYQRELLARFPAGERLRYRIAEVRREKKPRLRTTTEAEDKTDPEPVALNVLDAPPEQEVKELKLIERAHPDLGRLGVFWHTQGSGKSYSMAFFAEKVRRTVDGNFTFVIMTDREDLDDQIYKTFVGCGIADKQAPRPANGKQLQAMLGEDHPFVFSLIHKFNQPVSLHKPYTRRDDIIVISDEAHRTQAGKLARNMRMALPDASFIGFTGTPILKGDLQTRNIFGKDISRYDFRRSQQDGSTVKLIYENRGEKLGITCADLNTKIAEKIEEAELDDDKADKLHRLLGKDYEVVTAPERLEKVADDFVVHCAKRWKTGKFMLVCIDKVTCGRMWQLIIPRWEAKTAQVRTTLMQREVELAGATGDAQAALQKETAELAAQLAWLEQTLVRFIVSDSQGEVAAFNKWGIDIRPHRDLIKQGFETPDGRRVAVDEAFKDPNHPFRVAIVCAMWLTGFDVECLSTLYIDKPMKAHTLMQAIARPNRVYEGKACGVVVDYNGMLQSLNEALAEYALGDEATDEPSPTGGLVDPPEVILQALLDAIEEAEATLRDAGFDPTRFDGAEGFDKAEAFADAVDALHADPDSKRRFQIAAQQVITRFNALVHEPSVFSYVTQRDNLETILKKLEERRDNADITDILMELQRIVGEAIGSTGRGADQADGLKIDLSQIDFDRLQKEFAKKAKRKATTLKDIQDIIEARLNAMLAINPTRVDFYNKYQEIVAAYNREKDRATIEETFRRLMKFARSLDEEEKRAAREGLSQDEQTLFDLLYKEPLAKTERERLKQASRQLLATLQAVLAATPHWTANDQTQAEVEVTIRDRLFELLPIPPLTEADAEQACARVYNYIFTRSAAGQVFQESA